MRSTNENLGFWLGGNDLQSEGTWVWVDESPGKLNLLIFFPVWLFKRLIPTGLKSVLNHTKNHV